jgi:hypothetical protein
MRDLIFLLFVLIVAFITFLLYPEERAVVRGGSWDDPKNVVDVLMYAHMITCVETAQVSSQLANWNDEVTRTLSTDLANMHSVEIMSKWAKLNPPNSGLPMANVLCGNDYHTPQALIDALAPPNVRPFPPDIRIPAGINIEPFIRILQEADHLLDKTDSLVQAIYAVRALTVVNALLNLSDVHNGPVKDPIVFIKHEEMFSRLRKLVRRYGEQRTPVQLTEAKRYIQWGLRVLNDAYDRARELKRDPLGPISVVADPIPSATTPSAPIAADPVPSIVAPIQEPDAPKQFTDADFDRVRSAQNDHYFLNSPATIDPTVRRLWSLRPVNPVPPEPESRAISIVASRLGNTSGDPHSQKETIVNYMGQKNIKLSAATLSRDIPKWIPAAKEAGLISAEDF